MSVTARASNTGGPSGSASYGQGGGSGEKQWTESMSKLVGREDIVGDVKIVKP